MWRKSIFTGLKRKNVNHSRQRASEVDGERKNYSWEGKSANSVHGPSRVSTCHQMALQTVGVGSISRLDAGTTDPVRRVRYQAPAAVCALLGDAMAYPTRYICATLLLLLSPFPAPSSSQASHLLTLKQTGVVFLLYLANILPLEKEIAITINTNPFIRNIYFCHNL